MVAYNKFFLMRGICICLLFSIITAAAHGQAWKLYADSARAARLDRKPAVAAQFYLKALDELSKDSAGTYTFGSTCMSLGSTYINLAQYDKAKEMLEKAKSVLQKINAEPAVSDVWDNLGNMYRNTSRYDEAEQAYKEAKDIRERLYGKSHRFYASSCDNIGILYEITGRYNEGLALLTEARNIFSKDPGKESRSYAINGDNLGLLHKTIGKFAEAEKYMAESFELWKKLSGEESLDFGVVCNNLGLLYREMGEYEKSERILLMAKKIREKALGNQHPAYALVCNNLGGLFEKMGQYARSEQFLLEARRIYEKNKNQLNYTVNSESLGLLYIKTDSTTKALPYLQESYNTRKGLLGEFHPYTIASLINIGGVHLAEKRYDLAEKIFREVKYAYDEKMGKEIYGYGEVCSNLGWICYLTGKLDEAEKLSLEALQNLEENLGRENIAYPLFCNNMGLIFQEKKRDRMADSLFHESFAASRKRMEKVFRFTSEYEKQSYLQTLSGDKDIYFTFRYDRLSPAEAGEAYDRNIYFRNLILSSIQQLNKNIYENADPAIAAKYDEWKLIRQQLAFWLIKPETEQHEEKIKLEEKSNSLEKELTLLSSEFKKQQDKDHIDWKKIRSSLGPGEAAIEFSDFTWYDERIKKDSTYYIAFIIEPRIKEPVMVKLFEKNRLQSLLQRKSINEKNRINQLYADKELYEIIWRPLEKYLEGTKTIYYAPAGLLHYVSMSAIKSGNDQLVGNRYKLVQLLNTVSVTENKNDDVLPAGQLLLYGGIQYDADSVSLKKAAITYTGHGPATRSLPEDLLNSGDYPIFTPLPKTETEVFFIEKEAGKRKIQVQLLRGFNANEESFKSITSKSSPSVIHFATHAFFYPDIRKKRIHANESFGTAFKLSDNPLLRCGIIMAGASNTWKGKPVDGVEDGILTGYEVASMYLPNTHLVVLSACRTGLGDIQGNEGVYGLQRAFKIAGVKNIIMSLWDVDDNAGAEFMQLFYRDLLQNRNIGTAFKKAQDVMKIKYPTNPYLWAGFVLIR